MKIDQLPVDMLMEIFSFLRTYREVSLVNKLFYDIACKMDSNIYLRIDRQFHERFLVINAMQSNRQVSTVEIEILLVNLRRTIRVIENYSATIKCLKLVNVYTDESTFLEILSLVPNIEQLELGYVEHITVDQSSAKRRCNDDLNLQKLKKLSIYRVNFVDVFNRLPVGVLKELHITRYRKNELDSLFNRQRNIKHLKLSYNRGEDVTTDIFLKLKLESLELCDYGENFVVIAEILSKQTELKALILSDYYYGYQKVNDQVMDVITDHLILQVLKINVSRISVSSFVKIRQLKELKELTLKCGHDEGTAKLKALAGSDNRSIKKLSLRWPEMPVNLIAALANSTVHLTHLTILPHSKTQADAVMSHFNFVEVLEMEVSELLAAGSNYFNPKLRELAIISMNTDKLNRNLPLLIGAYPNLKKLKLEIKWETTLEIRRILNGFRKLESLIVKSAYGLIVPDLYCLNDHKSNLKYVSLAALSNMLTDELVKELRENFVVVKEGRGLKVAVDRYTINCERF